MSDVVLTWLLTATADPQRSAHLSADPALLEVLRDSVNGHGHHMVILTDCLDMPDDGGTTWVKVPPGGNPYFYRWTLTADYLDAHPEIQRVWTVDGTDVEMMHDPFPHMEPGALYVGSELATLGGTATADWLRKHCPSIREWQHRNGRLTVVNVGVIGGDRATVADVARKLSDAEADGDDWEMGAFQRIVYTDYPEHITGPMVHTVLRRLERDKPAWWRHK
jgi:hypothetical protein